MSKYHLLFTLVFWVFNFSCFSQDAWLTTSTKNFKKIDIMSAKSSEKDIIIDQEKTFQKIDGFGGSFNELGYIALQNASSEDQERVFEALFGSEGLNFEYCRMPIGANDFSKEWYSFSETSGDFEMAHFDISRDKLYQVPFIKRALDIQPDLRIWASPWSPPIWLKRNKHYGGRATNMYWGELYGNNMEYIYANNRFIMEPDYLQAYALYFSKFLTSYKQLGIKIESVHPQNEVTANQLFPSCVWSAEDLATFTGDYLIPQLKKDHPAVKVWLGTLNADSVEYVSEFLKNCPDIAGIGVQWDGIDMLDTLTRVYPEYSYMQTESECNNGLNEWFTAEHTIELLYKSLRGGASSYMYWNMILDDLGLSTWMWRQNSLISVDRFNGEVTFNPEFYVLKHFSHFINAGFYRVDLRNVPEGIEVLAFTNQKEGSILVLYNPSDKTEKPSIRVDTKTALTPNLPPHSIMTIKL